MKLRIASKDGKYWLQERIAIFEWRDCKKMNPKYRRDYRRDMFWLHSTVDTLEEALEWAAWWREQYEPKKAKIQYYKV